MDKKITDNPEVRYALGWNQMSEEQRILTTSALDIKNKCLSLIADQFIQQHHDNTNLLHYLVERCEGDDPYTGVSGGTETAKVITEICERYLREQMVPPTIAGSLRWNEMRICEDLKLGEKGGGLPINERIEIGNRTIKKLTQLVGALEKSRQVEEVA
jgi:hypothetical protein